MIAITVQLFQRAYDGLVEAGNRNGLNTVALASQILQTEAYRYADLYSVGKLTGVAFVTRFTPVEIGSILVAAQQDQQVGELVTELINSPYVVLDDPRLAPALALLVGAGLLAAERIPEILYYDRPQPE